MKKLTKKWIIPRQWPINYFQLGANIHFLVLKVVKFVHDSRLMTSKSVVKSHPRILGAIKSRGPGRLGVIEVRSRYVWPQGVADHNGFRGSTLMHQFKEIRFVEMLYCNFVLNVRYFNSMVLWPIFYLIQGINWDQ